MTDAEKEKTEIVPGKEAEEAMKQKYSSTWKILLVLLFAAIIVVVIVLLMKKKTDNVEKHVTLGEYKGLTYTAVDTNVSDAEIDEIIQKGIDRKTSYELAEDRAGTLAEPGDIVNCSYVATYEGKNLESGSGNFEIGSGAFPEFENAISGSKIGDSISIKAVVPDNYTGIEGLESSSGVSVDFDVTLNYICIRHVPELDDDFANELTGGKCTTAAGLKDYYREKLENEKQESAMADIKQELIDKLIATSSFNDIDGMIEENYNTVHKTYEDMAEVKQVSLEEYVEEFYQSELADFEKNLRETMEELVKEQLVLQAVAEKEKLEVKKDSEIYKKMLEEYMKDYGYADKDQFLADYDEKSVLQSMTYDRAIDFIVASAKAES